LRIRYNAPVILTFTLLATAVLVVDQLIPGFAQLYFVCPARLSDAEALDYVRLFTYVLGHRSWLHLMSNFSFILLIGPVLEEKHRSGPILLMLLVTALATGILNVLLFNSGLMGASGIVFMLILLASITNIRSGEVPLSFILVVALFLARELINIFAEDDISQFAHILGGFCGSLFGFLFTRRGRRVGP
jgi:membrane associated rhomboid family serine protease